MTTREKLWMIVSIWLLALMVFLRVFKVGKVYGEETVSLPQFVSAKHGDYCYSVETPPKNATVYTWDTIDECLSYIRKAWN